MKKRILVVLSIILLMASGCGSMSESMPARTAMEQLLISNSVDQSVCQVDFRFDGASVYVDMSNLESYDRKYYMQRIRHQVLSLGGCLTSKAAEADIIVEVASGAASIDKSEWEIGIPEIPLPVPYIDGAAKIPALSFVSHLAYEGRAKTLISIIDAETRSSVQTAGPYLGDDSKKFWWVLGLGPIRR